MSVLECVAAIAAPTPEPRFLMQNLPVGRTAIQETGILNVPDSLWQSAPAGHNADVFAPASGGERFAPSDPFAVAKQGKAIDGVDNGTVIANQKMAHRLLVTRGQVELGRGWGRPARWLQHAVVSPFSR